MTYDNLVVAPGIQLDWNRVPGMSEALDTPFVSSNYTYGLAPKTWSRIKAMRSGTAVFTMPAGPNKCAGAPQKIAYLAADYWREQEVLQDIRVVLVLPTPAMFGVKVFSDELDRVVAKYGIEVHLNSEVTEIDGEGRAAIVTDNAAGTKESITYDFLHVVPPQSAPDWLKATPLADPANPNGYVEIDKHTMQHVRFPEVFAPGRRGLLAQLQDRGRDPQAGAGGGGEPARGDGRRRADRAVRGLRVVPDHHGAGPDAAQRVRLLAAAGTDVPAHRHHARALRHVAAQALRAAVHVLEPHAQGAGLSTGPRNGR